LSITVTAGLQIISDKEYNFKVMIL